MVLIMPNTTALLIKHWSWQKNNVGGNKTLKKGPRAAKNQPTLAKFSIAISPWKR